MARAARTAAGPLVMMRRRPLSMQPSALVRTILVFSRRYRRVDVQLLQCEFFILIAAARAAVASSFAARC